jgi:hypothetical protein
MGQVWVNSNGGATCSNENIPGARAVLENGITSMNLLIKNYRDKMATIPVGYQLQYLESDLSGQIQKINEEIKQYKGTIERHNRDFIDLESTTEPTTSSVYVLDNYTLWMLVLSYILFAFSIVFMYSHTHYYSISSILLSAAGMTLVSFFLFVLAIIVL